MNGRASRFERLSTGEHFDIVFITQGRIFFNIDYSDFLMALFNSINLLFHSNKIHEKITM